MENYITLEETVTRLSEIIKANGVNDGKGVSKANIKAVINAVPDLVVNAVKEGTTIHLYGLGNVFPNRLDELRINNPLNPGEFRIVPPRVKAGFEFAKIIQERVKGDK